MRLSDSELFRAVLSGFLNGETASTQEVKLAQLIVVSGLPRAHAAVAVGIAESSARQYLHRLGLRCNMSGNELIEELKRLFWQAVGAQGGRIDESE